MLSHFRQLVGIGFIVLGLFPFFKCLDANAYSVGYGFLALMLFAGGALVVILPDINRKTR